jgi:uridine monophosphate synthetase
VTVNPYLGYDSIEPFLRQPERGVFLLCKTSNPGSADLQNLEIASQAGASFTLYEGVAHLAQEWNLNDNLGLVVGATDPQALARVRALAPDLWILAPGVGAQGGDLRSALQAGLRQDGSGMLLPVSRSLSRAEDPRQAAQDLRLAINRLRAEIAESRLASRSQPVTRDDILADALLEAGCIRFGLFTLKSGMQSPVYIDLRRLISHPNLLGMVAEAYLPLLSKLSFDRLAALPYAAIPIATAISLKSGWPLIYPRKEVKAYGTAAEIEGEYSAGEQVVVIDDLVTTGGSKFEAIDKLAAAGLKVEEVVVLVDRESGASEALSQAGFRLSAVFTLTGLLDHWQRTGKVPEEQIAAVREFLKAQDV